MQLKYVIPINKALLDIEYGKTSKSSVIDPGNALFENDGVAYICSQVKFILQLITYTT